MKMLTAEDDPPSSNLLQKLLSPYGECKVATNGLEAIEVYQEAYVEKRPYDLICLDIMMPRIDGHEVLHRIRQLVDKNRVEDKNRVKVVMITALADRKNVTIAALGKCQGYLVKPIGNTSLSEKLEELKFLPKNRVNQSRSLL
jgi:two-component system chemotaxis response regulator CheY